MCVCNWEMDLEILTWDVNGLNNKVKRNKIEHLLLKQ